MNPITELYAFVADNADEEGIVGSILPGVGMTPLVAARDRTLKSMRAIAQQVANESGKEIRLIRMTMREEVETIRPQRAS